MKELSSSGHFDYWKVFDELIEKLNDDQKFEISEAFNEAKKCLNGLTDGWYEFKFSFEKTLSSNSHNISEEQQQIAHFLLTTLNKHLDNG